MPSSGQLTEGVYLLKIDPGCTLSTGLWHIKGLTHRDRNLTADQWKPDPLQLKWLQQPLNLTENPDLFSHPDVPDVNLPMLNQPKYDDLRSETSEVSDQVAKIQAMLGKHQIPWYVYLMIAVVGVLSGVFVVAYIRWKCKQRQSGQLKIEPVAVYNKDNETVTIQPNKCQKQSPDLQQEASDLANS